MVEFISNTLTIKESLTVLFSSSFLGVCFVKANRPCQIIMHNYLREIQNFIIINISLNQISVH